MEIIVVMLLSLLVLPLVFVIWKIGPADYPRKASFPVPFTKKAGNP